MSSNIRVAGLGAAVILATACSQKPVASPAPTPVPHDPSSYANTEAFVTTHLILDLTADFDRKTLSGTAELVVNRRNDNATELVLDTRDLTIRSVEATSGSSEWTSTAYKLDPSTAAFGSALRITMPSGADKVRITYSSSPTAKGLQWLTPAQTAGKKRPFLFSQAQAIQARSFIPLQDLPGVRVTYDATIHTPKDLVAVMAAEMTSGETGSGLFHFRMPQPIPSYLIALAIGDLVFKSMSERTGVWAEPSVVAAAAREFEDTEKMITTTEALYGRYRWGRYDLIVLPPSFPFGGMENPRLTFATPTVIVGDKSLVSLVAHELAHSWSGNLVTNATWTDFWLNEGFTTYLERRIVEALYGRPFAQMEGAIGISDLKQDRAVAEQPGDKTLQPNLEGRDPDEASSRVPYEQGALFLTFLEAKVGREAFDQFLRQWFDEHAFESATTQDFLTFLNTHLLSRYPGAVTDAQIQEWLHTESIPAFAVLPQSDAFMKVERARDAWLGGGSVDTLAKSASAWSTQEWIHFIDTLPRPMEAGRMAGLDRQFTLTESQNAEIAHVWFRLAIASRYAAAYAAMERYMVGIGRRKLIVPLYRDLVATPDGRALAVKIYRRAQDGYHAMTKDGVNAVLKRGA